MQKSFGTKNDPDTTDSPSLHQANSTSSSGDLRSLESELAKREGVLEERERLLVERHKILDEKLEAVEKLRKSLVEKSEKVANVSPEEAKKILLENIEKELAAEISRKIRAAEEEVKLEADKTAKEILSDAMLHGVTDYLSEFTTSQVPLADEEMKGRIIGKEGRNIRSFEQATGVDVIMDNPGVLILSSFDPVRREIAKVSLEKLIKDGRIQPERIEEIVAQTKEDIEKLMCEAGEKLCSDVGVYNLPAELVCLLGRFKYRYSYGQNMILHTLEETQIGIALAHELGADVNIVRVGCLLHDIGKILTDWDEGTHVEKGVQLAKKFGLPQGVIDCIAQHHEDEPFSSVESVICYIADAISGGRPGARRENVEEYIKRIADIEKIATSFDGVESAFAVAAGREVRVIVFPETISDEELPKLTHDIAERISKEVMVPGQVKITAIREVRATEYTLTS